MFYFALIRFKEKSKNLFNYAELKKVCFQVCHLFIFIFYWIYPFFHPIECKQREGNSLYWYWPQTYNVLSGFTSVFTSAKREFLTFNLPKILLYRVFFFFEEQLRSPPLTIKDSIFKVLLYPLNIMVNLVFVWTYTVIDKLQKSQETIFDDISSIWLLD